MKVLFLGPADSPLLEYLESVEDEVVSASEPIDMAFIEKHRPDFIVSYGYRHIIKKDILDRYDGRAVNLHISLLPWNRGADPNFWSFIENTPKGVTIHYLDQGVDTGDIIVQKQVGFSDADTLRTSYDILQSEIQKLFKENWSQILTGECRRIRQEGEGSLHKLKDKEPLLYLLTDGWDTPISTLEKYSTQKQAQEGMKPNG